MNPDIKDYIRQRCDRYLGIRPRTEKEMQLYLERILRKKNIHDPDEQTQYIDWYIKELYELKLLDDEAFAEWYVAEKHHFKPRGRIRLKAELSQKGVRSDIIDKVLDNSDTTDQELLQKIVSKKLLFKKNITKKEKQKLIQHLQRKGFRFSDSKSAIEEYMKKE